MEIDDLSQYIIQFDKDFITLIDNNVKEKGLEKCLNRQLIYLDCSRVYKDGSRAMQTIGYPYQKEISTFIYLLSKCTPDMKQFYEEELIKLHNKNIEYEKENPPIWYGGKKAKAKWDKEHGKLPRRRNVTEKTISGFGKELSNTERLKRLSAQFGNLTFKIKPLKKD